MPPVISDHKYTALQKDGFTVLDNFLPKDLLGKLRILFDALMTDNSTNQYV